MTDTMSTDLPDTMAMATMPVGSYMTGDAARTMRAMDPGSVDLVLTSPPFLGLRQYTDDPDEFGQEGTPGEFIDRLLDVAEACRHVLAPHGSIVIELGDSYSDSGGAGGDYYNADGRRAGQPKPSGTAKLARKDHPRYRAGREHTGRPGSGQTRSADYVTDKATTPGRAQNREPVPAHAGRGAGMPLGKSLVMIPELFRVALGYGINPLTGRETDRWVVRQRVIWCKPDPSVGDVGDKYRPASTDLVVATQNRDRFFDLYGVRDPATTVPNGTRPPYDWWVVRTGRYRGAHFATWPAALLTKPIVSMCPARVCTTCGRPSERIVVKNNTGQNTRKSWAYEDDPRAKGAVSSGEVPDAADWSHGGWTDCGHGTWRRGRVLDPFAGSGTTLMAATGMDRDGIGIDVDPDNVALAMDRVGPMFFTHQEAPCETT